MKWGDLQHPQSVGKWPAAATVFSLEAALEMEAALDEGSAGLLAKGCHDQNFSKISKS